MINPLPPPKPPRNNTLKSTNNYVNYPATTSQIQESFQYLNMNSNDDDHYLENISRLPPNGVPERPPLPPRPIPKPQRRLLSATDALGANRPYSTSVINEREMTWFRHSPASGPSSPRPSSATRNSFGKMHFHEYPFR